MAARRPAKIAIGKKATNVKLCPSCQSNGKEQAMSVMKMVRITKPSGMFWVCPSCNAEVPTHQ
ncbi:MAG: hypothetical protein WC966_08965 [Bradymonadales bacterium]|jgi:hypothetical protein